MSEVVFDESIKESKNKLLAVRVERIRPGLDDKLLTSWNALFIKGYIDSYKAIGDETYLEKVNQIADFIVEKMSGADFQLYRTFKNGDARINAFLDDYSFTIEAFIALYQASFDETWLERVNSMTAYVIENFYDDKSSMFFYTSVKDVELVARKMEVMDNVIPSSNA